MKLNTILSVFGIVLFLTSCNKKETIMPPVAEKIPKEITIHKNTRVDNYYWMNQREDPKVIEYLNAENDYKEEVLAHTAALQESLFEEIKSKIKQQDKSVPYLKSGYYYYTRTVPESEYYLLCRKKEYLQNEEKILLDVNKLAEGYDYFQLGDYSVSPDNKLLAYGVDTLSRRKYTIYFKNILTGKILEDKIPLTNGNVVWANDNKTVYYELKNEQTLRTEKILKHKIGTPVSSDVEVFFEADETFGTYVYKSRSNKYIIIASESTLTSEARFLDANEPNGQFKIIQPRTRGLEYSVDHFASSFFIRTNLDAFNFKLVKTPVSKTEKENWDDVIPHREAVFLSGFKLFKNNLVVSERISALNQIRVIPWIGDDEYYIAFDEEVYSVNVGVNEDANTNIVRFDYSSLTTPNSTFDFDMSTKERTLLKQEEVLGGFNSADYETHREYATAGDGTKIPISLVYKKGLKKDGANPTVIYGYGSYGYSMDPSFRLSILPLLDRGFVYAIAHIRGGQEFGRKWYEDGKLLKKMNTFTDFNDCSQYLIDNGYTSSEKLFARGGSAGGLLVGACVNMRPGLYKGILAHVPFVDVVTTMLDESIPLTTSEFDEWGNPKEEKSYYYMLSYSPYDNVGAKDYPAILVTTGLHDSQVQYWEPAKWVAKLRDLKTDDNLLVFHINMDFGHGGASGRFEWIKETALEYAFVFNELGITE